MRKLLFFFISLCIVCKNSYSSCSMIREDLPGNTIKISSNSMPVDGGAFTALIDIKFPRKYKEFPFASSKIYIRNSDGHFMYDLMVDIALNEKDGFYISQFLISNKFLKDAYLEVVYNYIEEPCARFSRRVNLLENIK